MSCHRHARHALIGDLARAGFGIAVTFGPLAGLDVLPALAVVLWGLGLVFLWFGANTIMQACMVVHLTDQGIERRLDGVRWTGLHRSLRWSGLSFFRLDHYAPRRGSAEGWMQLMIGDGRQRLRLASTLEGFDEIVAAALKAATLNDLTFDPATSSNLEAMGLGRADGERAM